MTQNGSNHTFAALECLPRFSLSHCSFKARITAKCKRLFTLSL